MFDVLIISIENILTKAHCRKRNFCELLVPSKTRTFSLEPTERARIGRGLVVCPERRVRVPGRARAGSRLFNGKDVGI